MSNCSLPGRLHEICWTVTLCLPLKLLCSCTVFHSFHCAIWLFIHHLQSSELAVGSWQFYVLTFLPCPTNTRKVCRQKLWSVGKMGKPLLYTKRSLITCVSTNLKLFLFRKWDINIRRCPVRLFWEESQISWKLQTYNCCGVAWRSEYRSIMLLCLHKLQVFCLHCKVEFPAVPRGGRLACVDKHMESLGNSAPSSNRRFFCLDSQTDDCQPTRQPSELSFPSEEKHREREDR